MAQYTVYTKGTPLEVPTKCHIDNIARQFPCLGPFTADSDSVICEMRWIWLGSEIGRKGTYWTQLVDKSVVKERKKDMGVGEATLKYGGVIEVCP